jgi:CheY-like chemotaxis protein
MNEAVRARVFDPFFTTKKKERGTGLGLASAYSIIKNHGGAIQVRSKPEKGAEFIIYLPACPASGKGIEEQPSRSVLRGSETILLVDDEELILDVGGQLLERTGYKPLLAGNGLDALQIYQERGAEISLVVLDMVMPDMDGDAVFNALKEINPDVRVLLSSGYSEFGKAEAILKRGCEGFLQKPFNVQELTTKIRQILDN